MRDTGATNSLVMLWEFAHEHIENDRVPNPAPEFLDYLYPELVLRGLTHMVPGLADYLERIPPTTQVRVVLYALRSKKNQKKACMPKEIFNVYTHSMLLLTVKQFKRMHSLDSCRV